MIAKTLALVMALAFTVPAFAAPKAPHHKPNSQIVAEHKVVEAKITVNGIWGKNKKLEKIVAVATVPLSQISQTGKARKKGMASLTIIESKNGKRTIKQKNITKSSELYNKLRATLDESITYFKQNHVEASSSLSSSGKKNKKK